MKQCTRAHSADAENSPSLPEQRVISHVPSKEILVLGLVLGILQVLDAVLTGYGIHISPSGSAMEANPLIRALIDQIGLVPALALAKSLAIIVIIALCLLAPLIHWLSRAMKAVIVIYVAAAIIPWTTIILTRVL